MPGPNGTTNLIGRVGHVSAGAAPLKSTRTNTRSERRAILISFSCLWAFQANTVRPDEANLGKLGKPKRQ
jgi:hypothetical protein